MRWKSDNHGRAGRGRSAVRSGARRSLGGPWSPRCSPSPASSPSTTRWVPRRATCPPPVATGRRWSPRRWRPPPFAAELAALSRGRAARPGGVPRDGPRAAVRVPERARAREAPADAGGRAGPAAEPDRARSSTGSSCTPTRWTTRARTARSAPASCSRTWTPASRRAARSPSCAPYFAALPEARLLPRRRARALRRPVARGRRAAARRVRGPRCASCTCPRSTTGCRHVPLTAEHEARYGELLRRCPDVPWILEAPLP